MDTRIRRLLILAAVLFIIALLFLWAIHWMGSEIKNKETSPGESSSSRPERHVLAVDLDLHVRPAVADEFPNRFEANAAPLVVADVRGHHSLDPLGFSE